MNLILSAILLAMGSVAAQAAPEPNVPVGVEPSSSIIVLLHADPKSSNLNARQSEALTVLQAAPGFKPGFAKSPALMPEA
jgi:hypothetical protein